MAKHPAAFINTIAEGRNFDEAIKHLQETWDELQDVKAALIASQELLVTSLNYKGNEYKEDTEKQIHANRDLIGPLP